MIAFALWCWKNARRIFSWIGKHPAEATVFLLVIVVAAHALIIDPRLRRKVDQAKSATVVAIAQRDAERAAHVMTKRMYRQAQMDAARQEELRNARVAAQQEEISDGAVETLARRQAAARADAARAFERLRQYAAAGKRPAGAGGAEQLPAVPVAAAGTAAAPGDGLPADIGPADIDWRLIAQEQAIQLDVLIDWTIRQAGVPVNEPQVQP